MTKPPVAYWVLLPFDRRHRLLVRHDSESGELQPFDSGDSSDIARIEKLSTELSFVKDKIELLVETTLEKWRLSVFCGTLESEPNQGVLKSLEEIETEQRTGSLKLSPLLSSALEVVAPEWIRIPYLNLGENEYVHPFRTVKERNRSVYVDGQSETLYQSTLCSMIKAVRRTKEKSSDEPAILNFGAVRYVIPSHFGFCLGVQNAIERAYEAMACNPGKRVFMLSELIHNPFVNEDLLSRGLRYLQTDKGQPLRADGTPARGMEDRAALWNQLTSRDIVVIPAFGATNEDKVRLIRRGISIREYDATCMLVEKVWKAARRYAKEGFTVLIHGKSEHEETKATFSNASDCGPALIIRNMAHAKVLAEVIRAEGKEKTRLFKASFSGLCSEGFDPVRDLEKLALVNQTTLLRNETLSIMEFLRKTIAVKYGEDRVAEHLWTKGKGDTLCYATQVNQDALRKCLEVPITVAIVVGGRNSSNTYQLYRVCEERFGDNAHYIQSESNILSLGKIRHYVFPSGTDKEALRPFFKISDPPPHILLTGGASCPDGIIQQVIGRINGFFPPESLFPVETVLENFKAENGVGGGIEGGY